MDGPLLRFDIRKGYGEFRLECGGAFESGITAIFGPSGSGKTTLLNCIAGMTVPDSGEIQVLGETVYSSSLRKNMPPERRRFGYVFQDSMLFPHMSVWDNIRYGYKLTAVQHRRIEPEQLVDLFGVKHLLDRSVAGLSGGEGQRVALARALATSPRLLLLDEPLASLDLRLRGVILQYLRRVWRELQTPMLYVSHSISEVMTVAEAMLVLSEGRPVAYGRPSQLLVQPGMRDVADFATFENLLEAEVVARQPDRGLVQLRIGDSVLTAPDGQAQPGESVTISVRAGDVILALDRPERISARNILKARVEEVHDVGPLVLVYTDIGTRLVAEVTAEAAEDLELREGQEVYLVIKTNSIMVLDPYAGATG